MKDAEAAYLDESNESGLDRIPSFPLDSSVEVLHHLPRRDVEVHVFLHASRTEMEVDLHFELVRREGVLVVQVLGVGKVEGTLLGEETLGLSRRKSASGRVGQEDDTYDVLEDGRAELRSPCTRVARIGSSPLELH